MEDSIRVQVTGHDRLGLILEQVGLGAAVDYLDAGTSLIHHGRVKDRGQSAFGINFLVVTRYVRDIEAEGQRLGVVLDCASDNRT